MPLHDGVVADARRFGGIALDDLDAQPAALRLRVQLRQHGRRQVQRRDAVTLTRQQQAQEPGPRTRVEHTRRRRRQQPAQSRRPHRQFHRRLRIVPGRMVVGRRVEVPVLAHPPLEVTRS